MSGRYMVSSPLVPESSRTIIDLANRAHAALMKREEQPPHKFNDVDLDDDREWEEISMPSSPDCEVSLRPSLYYGKKTSNFIGP